MKGAKAEEEPEAARSYQAPQVERPRVSLPSLDDNYAWRDTALADATPWERSEAINAWRTAGNLAAKATFAVEFRSRHDKEPISQFAEIAELALRIEATVAEMFPTPRVRR